MMFSLTSSLIRPVSLPNTTRQLDLTVLRNPQSRQDYAFKHSNQHKGGEKCLKNRSNFKKAARQRGKNLKTMKTDGVKNNKSPSVPSCVARCFAGKVVMTVHEQPAIPRGRLGNSRMITNTVELACMNSELIGIISLLPRSLLHFNVDSK